MRFVTLAIVYTVHNFDCNSSYNIICAAQKLIGAKGGKGI